MGLLFGQSCLEQLDQVRLVPVGDLSFGLDATLARAFVLGEVHGDLTKQGDVLGAVVGADA